MYRLDNTGRIQSFRETPEGFLDLYLSFSRVGPLEYQRSDGRIETEYVTSEELFDEESLATATGKPITYLHPPEQVTSHNFWKFARGATGTKILRDDPFVTIVGTVHDAGLINIIKSGKAREVSAGYNVEVVKKSDGKLYQTARRYNHFSIVPEGRAGSEVRVHYGDSNDMFETSPNEHDALRRATETSHSAAMQRHKRPLALNKESSKKHRTVPRVTKQPGDSGPLDHLKRQQP